MDDALSSKNGDPVNENTEEVSAELAEMCTWNPEKIDKILRRAPLAPGMERFFHEKGIKTEQLKNGDRFLIATMKKNSPKNRVFDEVHDGYMNSVEMSEIFPGNLFFVVEMSTRRGRTFLKVVKTGRKSEIKTLTEFDDINQKGELMSNGFSKGYRVSSITWDWELDE